MASNAIPTILLIATPLCSIRAFETPCVVIDHCSYHRKIDRFRWNRAKEGGEHADKKTGRQRFNQSLSDRVGYWYP